MLQKEKKRKGGWQALRKKGGHHRVLSNKQQTNTLLSPDTIQCTRGQNIKQIHSS